MGNLFPAVHRYSIEWMLLQVAPGATVDAMKADFSKLARGKVT
jgi:hypothetical protein